MRWKGSAILALLFAVAQGSTWAAGAATGQSPAGAGQTAPATTPAPRPSTPRPVPAAPGSPAQRPVTQGTSASPRPAPNRAASAAANSSNTAAPASGSDSGVSDEQPAHITIATPAPAPSPWPWQERIAWAANLILVLLGYAGILLAVSMLRKIERQTQYAESAAQAAADSARASLLHAEAIERAERPWILITAEPSRRVDNGFVVTATNRGRSPARIVSSVDKVTTAPDQSSLPEEAEYEDAKPNAELASVILLPGESTGVKTFSRDEVKGICGGEEKLRRVEKWEEVILLYGKIIYLDLIAPGDPQPRETAWCCWYIHGRQKSGMVMAGSGAYNRHT